MMKSKIVKSNILKGSLLLSLLIVGSAALCLSGCGRKELLAAHRTTYKQQISIEGELWWKSCFSWNYFAQSGSGGSEKIGCFVAEESERKMKPAEQAPRNILDFRQEGETIEVYHDILSEEDFFLLINRRVAELEKKYPEEEIIYRINGSTEIDQFVQLDVGREHRLYIRLNDSVYVLFGEMKIETWQDFLEKWLFTFGLRWDGLAVMRERGEVADTYTGNQRAGIRRLIQFEKAWIKIDAGVILFHAQEEGFYIETEAGGIKQSREEVFLRPTENYPEHSNAMTALVYLQKKYPDMYCLNAYLFGRDTLWNFEEEMLDNIFYEVKDLEGTHGIFLWNGEPYEIFNRKGSGSYYQIVEMAKEGLEYDYNPYFTWYREENGGVSQSDRLANIHFYKRDLGNGKIIRIQATATKTETVKGMADHYEKHNTYRIEIYDGQENKLIQKIQVDSIENEEPPFVFEDFNADGYLDLTAVCWLGTFGGLVRHYIYDPAEGKFLELDSEFEYCVNYYTEPKARKLHIYSYGPALTGREAVYQWKNKTDYEILKQFWHEETEGFVRVKIARYKEGKEEILSDYLYSREEYMNRSDIWGTYHEDFIWEKEVTDRATGKRYMIRYAEVFQEKYAKENGGIYYDGRIYLYDEDTYLVSVTHSEIISKSESIAWEDGDEDRDQALVLHYVDGGESAFGLSGLIQPDYS